MATIGLIMPTPDDGRTMIQWRIPDDDIEAVTAELHERFGEPVLESITEPGLIDDVTRFTDGRGGVIHLTGA